MIRRSRVTRKLCATQTRAETGRYVIVSPLEGAVVYNQPNGDAAAP